MTEDQLKNDGWKYIGKCNCNLTLNIKYQKDDFILYLMPKRRQFYIKQYNNKIVAVKPTIELQSQINKLYAQNTEA